MVGEMIEDAMENMDDNMDIDNEQEVDNLILKMEKEMANKDGPINNNIVQH